MTVNYGPHLYSKPLNHQFDISIDHIGMVWNRLASLLYFHFTTTYRKPLITISLLKIYSKIMHLKEDFSVR